MEPASRIIAMLGGPSRLSDAIGVHRVTVAKWKQPKSKGGTDGAVPRWHIPRILKEAGRQGVALTAADFAPAVEAAE